MAEKSPILEALEKNTKAIQGLHKGMEGDRKGKTSPSGGGAGVDSAPGTDGKPKDIKDVASLGAHAKDALKERAGNVKGAIGDAVHKTSEFAKGDFLGKIPIVNKLGGGFIADVLKRKRDDKKRFKQEQQDEELRVQDEEDTEEKRYLATLARAAGVSKFQFGGKEYDESDFNFKEESSVGSPDDSSEESSNLLSTLVSLAQQTNRLLIDGLGVRSPGYLHDLLLLSKGDKLKDREELLEKKEDRKEEKEEKKKAKSGILRAVVGRGIRGIGGLLKNTLIPLLGTMASVIGPILLPIMAVALAAGLGLMVGNYIYKHFVEGWIDDWAQEQEDKMNATHARTFKESKIITGKDEEGKDILETAFKVPKGHKDFGRKQVISETEARKYFEANKENFERATFEEAIESGELQTQKYTVNKADPSRVMSGQRTYESDNVAKASLTDIRDEINRRDRAGEAALTPEEISDMRELVHAEFLQEVDEKLRGAKDATEFREILKSLGVGNYVSMIKRNKELTAEAKERLLTGFASSRMVERFEQEKDRLGYFVKRSTFDEAIQLVNYSPQRGYNMERGMNPAGRRVSSPYQGYEYDFTRKSIAPISLSPTSAVEIVAAVEENNEAQASGKGNNPSTTVINNNPVTTSVKNDTHVNSMPTVNTDAALQMANRNDFGS